MILRSLGWEARDTFTPMHPRDPGLAALFGWGAATAAGVAVNPETAMRSVAVFACVQVIAQTVGQVDLCLHQRKGENVERAVDHPLYDLLVNQPNRFQTPVEFKEMLQGHIALRGNGYAEILSTGGKGVAELLPRHPDRLRPFWAPDGRRAYAYSDPNGPQRVILQHEMLHIMGLSSDGLSGISPISYQRNAIGLDLAQEEFAGSNIANGTRPSGALSVAGKLNDDARANLKKSWTEAMSGSRNSGKVAILEEGLKWEQLGMTLEDAQFLEQRKFSIEQISRIFRVPLHMIGELSRSTHNNIEQQALEFVQFTMVPCFVKWQQAIGRDCLSQAERRDYFARFDLEQLSSADLATRIQLWDSGRQWGYLNADEIRAAQGRNPLPNKEGQAYLQPVNMAAVGSVDAAITAKVKEALKNADTQN